MTKTYTDQMGNEVQIPVFPERIISLVPSQTELLYDLGLGNRIVGATKFCVRPGDDLLKARKIGGTKTFNFKSIDALKPDLIIGNKEENYAEGIAALKEKYPVWMSDIYTLDDALEMIGLVGNITGTYEKAHEIINAIKTSFSKINRAPALRTAYFIWRKPYMVAASGTFIHEMLGHIGLNNVFEALVRYPEIDVEALANAKPDLIFLSSEPYPFKETHTKEIQAICPGSKILIVDGEMFSWYGSRLKHAMGYFNELYKNIKQ